MKKIAVIGTGYVGLVTGACLAKMGNQVMCLDIDQDKIHALKTGILPFYEPGLQELVIEGMNQKKLHFTSDYSLALLNTKICFFALPTPSNPDGSCDLSFLFVAARQLASVMQEDLVLVNKSTVPVGTAKKVSEVIQETLDERNIHIQVDVISNPEFLREGTAVADCLNPDRILLGVDREKGSKVMQELYAPFAQRVLIMDTASAELSKYAANAMLGLRISFMNEIAGLCEKLGADVESIKRAMGKDERIGFRYLNPGIGFGGSCLPKDIRALSFLADQHGHSTHLFDEILEINERQKELFFSKILTHYCSLKGKNLAIWGLSFKPDTDDLREAPSLYLIQKCLDHGAFLRLYDPKAMPKAQALFGNHPRLQFCENVKETTLDSDGIILITEWKEFKKVDFEKIALRMNQKVFFDGRNQYSDAEMIQLGFDYIGIGKRKEALVFHDS